MGTIEPEVSSASRQSPFNSPLECGLRALVLLVEAYPKACDLQRLVYYDYLLVHSKDAGGPESLHPATPHRSGELLVRRELLETGLLLFLSRGLIEQHFSAAGIAYVASETAAPFLDSLAAQYAVSLYQRAGWVISSFGGHADNSLAEYFRSNLDQWGAEFETESLFREIPG
jgi:hypothetical protein